MIDYEYDNCRTSVIDTAILNGIGTKEDVELYNQLSIALELIDDDFNVIYSDINDGIDFGITTPYPNGLPEKVGVLFFDTDLDYNVNIKEVLDIYDGQPERYSNIASNPSERYFAITIKRD